METNLSSEYCEARGNLWGFKIYIFGDWKNHEQYLWNFEFLQLFEWGFNSEFFQKNPCCNWQSEKGKLRVETSDTKANSIQKRNELLCIETRRFHLSWFCELNAWSFSLYCSRTQNHWTTKWKQPRMKFGCFTSLFIRRKFRILCTNLLLNW